MRFDWRAISGPALTIAATLIAIVVDRYLVFIPSPSPLFICIVAFAASYGGLVSGLVTAVVAVGCATLFFLSHHAAGGYDLADLVRLLLLATTAVGTATIIGLLRKRLTDAFALERAHLANAGRLSAALDQVDIGIVLLDSDTRAEFINRAFRDYLSLTDQEVESKPPFIALMYRGRDAGIYELPEDEMGAFIARRTEMMRAGDSTPININLADGRVLRFSCTALPDGGRMLSYTPVTDLVRRTDDPARAGYYQSLRRTGRHDRPPPLRAAE